MHKTKLIPAVKANNGAVFLKKVSLYFLNDENIVTSDKHV